MVGGLIVMVKLSGYENFVSAIDIKEDAEKLDCLGKLNAGSLKQKVAASIVDDVERLPERLPNVFAALTG